MKHEAIRKVHPNVVTINGDEWGKLQAWDKNGEDVAINQAAVDTEEADLVAAHAAQDYARNRATAYASTGDQLDMQYWDSVNDTTTWKDHIASVKAQFPKP